MVYSLKISGRKAVTLVTKGELKMKKWILPSVLLLIWPVTLFIDSFDEDASSHYFIECGIFGLFGFVVSLGGSTVIITADFAPFRSFAALGAIHLFLGLIAHLYMERQWGENILCFPRKEK